MQIKQNDSGWCFVKWPFENLIFEQSLHHPVLVLCQCFTSPKEEKYMAHITETLMRNVVFAVPLFDGPFLKSVALLSTAEELEISMGSKS